jgi:hypothetical protein
MVDAYTTASTSGINLVTGANTVFSGSSQLVRYDYSLTGLQTGLLGGATVSFSATDGIIGWGRWSGGPTAGNAAPQPMTGTFDYVIGIPTPIASLPTSTANYTLMGYTSPTATNGSTTPYSVNGILSAYFATGTVGVNINVTNGTYAYSMNNTANPLIAISGSTFSGFINTTSSTSSCPSSCPTTINGFFAGTNASRAGLSYTITSAGGGTVQGVAVFAKN